MPIYFAGRTDSTLFPQDRGNIPSEVIKKFTQITYPELKDIEIGYNYLLLWQSENLLISPDPNTPHGNAFMNVRLPDPADKEYCKFVVPHHQSERISILSTNNVFWEYDIDGNIWEMKNIFRPRSSEHAVKIIHCQYNMLLTNLGRLLNMDDYLEIAYYVKFIDIVVGAKHAILLAENSDIYSIIFETKLENGIMKPGINCPILMEELQGLKIVQIAAGGWHSAAITEQGDLYTWGFNACGELGHSECHQEWEFSPKLVRFQHKNYSNIEVKVKKVQCGNYFTICLADDGTLWSAGSNAYGQFGKPRSKLLYSERFIKLDITDLGGQTVKDFKCNESATAIITE